MSKPRVITSIGPTKLSLTNSTGVADSGWKPWGPFKGNQFGSYMVFSPASSGLVGKLWGVLWADTTVNQSTVNAVALDSHDGADAASQSISTSVFLFNYVKLRSTTKTTSATNTVTATFGAVV